MLKCAGNRINLGKKREEFYDDNTETKLENSIITAQRFR